MARFRWRRYRRRRYPRRFRRRGYRRGRVINRSPRSRVKVNFTAESFVDLPWPGNRAVSDQLYISPFYQNVTPHATRHYNFLPASLCSQASYMTFASCYEQCRLIGCKVMVTINTPVGASQNFTDVTMYSAIVRQFSLYDMEHNMLPWATIGSSSSSKRVTFVNNTVNKLGRACYASDLQERIDFVDSQTTWPNGCEVSPAYPDGTTLNDQYVGCLTCQMDTDSNVVHPKFCPMFVFQGNTSDQRSAARTLKLLVRISGTFEFRGPRFGNATASSSKVATPASDAKIPLPEGGDDMDVVLPDDPTQPTAKRAKLDEDDDDICLPEEERSTAPAAKLDEDDEPAYNPKWRKDLVSAGKPTPVTGRQLLQRFMDKDKNGKIDNDELYKFLAPLRALPKPALDALVGYYALDEGDAKPGSVYTERWKDGKVIEKTYDGKPVDKDPYVYKYGATAAAETLEQAKNESTGGQPEQK